MPLSAWATFVPARRRCAGDLISSQLSTGRVSGDPAAIPRPAKFEGAGALSGDRAFIAASRDASRRQMPATMPTAMPAPMPAAMPAAAMPAPTAMPAIAVAPAPGPVIIAPRPIIIIVWPPPAAPGSAHPTRVFDAGLRRIRGCRDAGVEHWRGGSLQGEKRCGGEKKAAGQNNSDVPQESCQTSHSRPYGIALAQMSNACILRLLRLNWT